MTALVPTMQAFFTDRLIRQRHASPQTIAAYRDTMRLLLAFAQGRTGTLPSELDLGQLDADLIGAFLDHLQHARGNSISTRNARLAAIRSLYRFAALRHPEHAALIGGVLAIPAKRFEHRIITHLSTQEAGALLAAPDRSTWTGRRDHALLLLAIQTGLRASELTGLSCGDIHLETGAHVTCHGKGRKDRITPLTKAPSACCEFGSQNVKAPPLTRCSRPAPGSALAATRSNTASPSTYRSPLATVRRCARSRSPCTCCGTPARSACCTPGSTPL